MVALSTNVSVSVVIPCYRCKESIARAVSSVFEQTSRPVEVILVDDFSNDGTLNALYDVQKMYPADWIKVIPQSVNGGPGDARNAGWNLAKGKYVAFLDSDDSWHPRKIEIQFNWLENHQDVQLLGQYVGASDRRSPEPKDATFTCVSARRLLFSNRFSTSSVMLQKSMSFRFKPGKRYCEDYQLWSDICFSGCRCFNVDFPLVNTFKPVYGHSGLSGQLWRMERGELGVYWSLLQDGKIRFIDFVMASSWSVTKFLRRVINSAARRIK